MSATGNLSYTTADVSIRKATLGDIPLLVKIANQSYLEHYTYLWYDEGKNYSGKNFSPTIFEAALNDKSSHLYLVEWKQRTVGFIKLNEENTGNPYLNKDSLELERIYLLKEASGKGVGKQALGFVEQYARQKGKSRIILKAMEQSDALPFYLKLGFQIAEVTELDLPYMKDEYRKIALLVKQL